MCTFGTKDWTSKNPINFLGMPQSKGILEDFFRSTEGERIPNPETF
jgi:hypothetical protein